MADMQFDLVSPERSLASHAATSVSIPGADGDLTVMAGHTPTITTLRPGLVRVEADGKSADYVVTGGFVEINGDSVTVLAERALARGDMTQERLDEMYTEAENMYKTAKENWQNEPGPVDDAAKLLGDMVAMGSEIGLSTKQPNL